METLTGRYRLLEPLGSGGMSVVWRGYDEVLGRQVAVKILAAEFAADAAFRARIRREAQAAARLSDPHITNVYDYGEAADGTPFVVMELVDGPSLADRLRAGPLPWESVVRYGAQIAGALATAHARGLVHQDVKPANVMLAPSGVKVVDFGISAVAGERDPVVLGTPGYLAPEQRAGAPAQPATDVYALGMLMSRSMAPDAAIPAELRAVIGQCLSPDPADRPSAAALAATLTATPAPFSRPTRRMRPQQTRMLPPEEVGRRGTRIMPPPPPAPRRPARTRRWPGLATVAVLIFLACLAGAALVDKRHHPSAVSSPGAAVPAVTSPKPSPSPSPTVACRVDYQITDYKIGFQAKLTVTNTGTADVSGWTLAFELPSRQKLSAGWGGVWKQDGSRITVRDVLINAAVKPGKSVGLGFVGTYNGKNDRPPAFSLNNVPCGQSGA